MRVEKYWNSMLFRALQYESCEILLWFYNIYLLTIIVFQITPIHCAAINPNPKYLIKLLSVLPEYNITDKSQRRPIHYAAACVSPKPLEYLLSRSVLQSRVGPIIICHMSVNFRDNSKTVLRLTKFSFSAYHHWGLHWFSAYAKKLSVIFECFNT